jgi:hypothetical protein
VNETACFEFIAEIPETLASAATVFAFFSFADQRLKLIDLLQRFQFGGDETGVLEYSVGHSQMLGDHAIVIELQWLARPRQMIELPAGHDCLYPLFNDLVNHYRR